MEHWICRTCGTQFAASEQEPQNCPICSDQRQYVGYRGQTWATLAQLQADGFHNEFREHEPGLIGVGTTPTFAIGERALLLQHPEGNVLWDCMSLVDEATVAEIKRLGGLSAIAISHPHFYSTECALQVSSPSDMFRMACSAGKRTLVARQEGSLLPARLHNRT
jgi:hypothetical protein